MASSRSPTVVFVQFLMCRILWRDDNDGEDRRRGEARNLEGTRLITTLTPWNGTAEGVNSSRPCSNVWKGNGNVSPSRIDKPLRRSYLHCLFGGAISVVICMKTHRVAFKTAHHEHFSCEMRARGWARTLRLEFRRQCHKESQNF